MGAPLISRAIAGERIEVACRCGWDNDGSLTLIDYYTQEAPPGPRGSSCAGWLMFDVDDEQHFHEIECGQCGQDILAADETTYAERAPDLLAALKDSLDRAADAKDGT